MPMTTYHGNPTMHSDAVYRSWQLSQAIRGSAPLIHNITNLVVQNDTADAVAALGATQVTLHIPDEAAEAAGLAAALAVNTGTPDPDWVRGARAALDAAAARGTPWVLDPVAVGFTRYRSDIVREFLERGPVVVKANASEILVLAGETQSGRAADSIHGVAEASDAASELARRLHCTVVVSGSEDLITDGKRRVHIANGHPLLGQMIGSGCMLTAVVGCYLAVADQPFEAAVAAVACFTIAGEIAAERAGGPGTLKPLLLDALHTLDENAVRQRLTIRA